MDAATLPDAPPSDVTGDCTARHPDFGVPCQLPGHPHRHAHYASGISADGQRWTLWWWSPAAEFEGPDGKADEPPSAP